MKKQKKDQKSVVKKEMLSLFYMTEKEVTAREISESVQALEQVSVELWEAMNVLQIETQGREIDFEPVEGAFQDSSDAAFVKNRNIKTIFSVQCEKETLEIAKEVLKQMLEQWGGFFCTDSDDFRPIYLKEEL